MRPYKFQRIWIDLDTVQAITEPREVDRMGYGGYFVEFSIQFAFQDNPRIFSYKQETDWYENGARTKAPSNSDRATLIPEVAYGMWSKRAELMPEWEALVNAWKGTQ